MRLACLLVGLAIPIGVACSSGGSAPSGTATPQETHSPQTSAPTATPAPTPDVRKPITDVLPAYAGMFADETTKILYIFSSDPNIDVTLTRELLRANGVGKVAWDWERVVVLTANSTALFAAWWSELTAVAGRAATLTMIDNDEVNDKFVIGLESERDIARAKREIYNAHFPMSEIVFKVIQFDTDL